MINERSKELEATLVGKAADYATNQSLFYNFEFVANAKGETVVSNFMGLVLLKASRLTTLLLHNRTAPRNESVQDTLKDLHGYLYLLETYLHIANTTETDSDNNTGPVYLPNDIRESSNKKVIAAVKRIDENSSTN